MDGSAASSSAAAATSIEAVCTLANLSPIYGMERARSVIKYVVEDFLPFADNFSATPMRAQIQRGQSQGLLLSLQHTQQQNKAKVWLGIFFPPAFPTRPPQAALLLAAHQSIAPNHPLVAPNGAVHMERLDCGANPDMLLNMLISLFVVLDEKSPVIDRSPPPQQQQQQAAAQQQQNANSSHAAAAVGSSGAQQQQQGSADGPALTPQQQQLFDLFVSDYHTLTDKFIAVRMEATAHAEVLAEAEGALRREAAALQQEIDLLQIAVHEQTALQSAIDAYNAAAASSNLAATTGSNNSVNALLETPPSAASSPPSGASPSTGGGIGSGNGNGSGFVPIENVTATDCVEPLNDLHAQALDLLATINAYEDQQNFLERCLSRRALSADQYLRHVNALAREEFQCRFLYQRVVDKIQRERTAAALLRQFGGRGVDEQVVNSVLAANAFSPARAERALTDMVS